MSEKEPQSTSTDMDEDNIDLTTITEIEISGDPKRDKVSGDVKHLNSSLGA